MEKASTRERERGRHTKSGAAAGSEKTGWPYKDKRRRKGSPALMIVITVQRILFRDPCGKSEKAKCQVF